VADAHRTEPIDITSSLKRIAWAFGCAEKGSMEELSMRALLVQKVRSLRGYAEHASDMRQALAEDEGPDHG